MMPAIMKALLCIGVVVALLLLEFLLFAPSFTGNLAKDPYRLEQRKAAAAAYERDRSPENLAAYKHEFQLAAHHAARRDLVRMGILFSSLFILDAFLAYKWIYGRKDTREA